AGAQGATGPAGSAGPTGPKGTQGQVGATGSTGPPGATGPAGPKGETGAQGPTGSQGVAGTATATVATATGAVNAPISVQCGSGRVAIGGGARLMGGGLGAVETSAPINLGGSIAAAGETPTGWTATVVAGGEGTAAVYAVCAP